MSDSTSTKLAPGPTSSGMLGLDFPNQFKRDPLETAMKLKQEWGDFICIKIGPVHWYLLNHPDQVKEVFVTRHREFGKTDRFKQVISSVDGNGLVVSEGDFWLKQRRTIQPIFHHDRLNTYTSVIVAKTHEALTSFRPGQNVDMSEEMTKLTLRAISKILFGLDVNEEAQQLGDAVTVLSQVMLKEFSDILYLPDWLPLPSKNQKRKATRTIDSFIYKAISAHQTSDSGGTFDGTAAGSDLLAMLLCAKDPEGDDQLMSTQQVRNEAITLFNAGHDSTAAALSWTWYLLMKHPDVYEKVIAEVDAVLGSEPATFKSLPSLKMTKAVIKEALRLYPPAWVIPRKALDDTEIAGYRIPKGSILNFFCYVIQRDERFFEQPDSFRPERFLPENEQALNPFAFFPFGYGPRGCIGKDLALMEMELIVATISQKVKFRLRTPHEEIKPNPLVSLEPLGGVDAVVVAR